MAAQGAIAAASTVIELIDKSGGVLGAAGKVIEQFNTLFGGVRDVQDKTRWLEVTVVNMSTEHTLRVDDNWFDSGRFWSQPFSSFGPGTSITFYVCNVDGGIGTGVSGGIGLQARHTSNHGVFSDSHRNSWWICTFSNPFIGSTKCLTRFKTHGIQPLFEEMHTAHVVHDSRCGCYMKENNKLVFIWKNPNSPW